MKSGVSRKSASAADSFEQSITTAGAICCVLDLLATDQLPQSGCIRQEAIPLKMFVANRFGKVFAKREFHQDLGGEGR